MPRSKGWKRAIAMRDNASAAREVSERGEYDVCLTDLCLTDVCLTDVCLTEELALLKTEKK